MRTDRSVRFPRLALALLLAGAPSLVPADVVVMRSGSRIACSKASPDGDRLRIELSGGGTLLVASADVKRIENGVGSVMSRAVITARASSGSPGGRPEEAWEPEDRVEVDPVERAAEPVQAETSYRRAKDAGRASPMPTVIGAMSGVQPTPTSASLAARMNAQNDATRQSQIEASQIKPGGQGIVSRVGPGSMSSGGRSDWTNNGRRDAPRAR